MAHSQALPTRPGANNLFIVTLLHLLKTKKHIFPVPEGISPGTQSIRLTRRMFFGRSVRPGASPGNILPLDLDNLRDIAQPKVERWDMALHDRKPQSENSDD
jgi:hypothetical protein